MSVFIISLIVLIVGYLLYGGLVERIFGSDPKRPTPAHTLRDDVDFVPMPSWKVFLIQFLNIAGLGPIFGAIMGVMFGPAAFLWIVFGTIFGGAVHDYLSGMISLRKNGSSLPEIVGEELGGSIRQVMRIFSLLLMILVGAVFVVNPADLLAGMTPDHFNRIFWICVIFAYYMLATLLPVDKLIGKIYPLFGGALLFMAVGLMGYMLFSGINIPIDMSKGLYNRASNAPDNPIFPMMFVSIACGAISGFHATQSPMMARCLKNEKMGRPIFYGAMVAEGIVALIWAAAAITFTGGYNGLENYMAEHNQLPAALVNDISVSWLGKVGGILAILGVVAAPITTGDTALRSARLIAADFLHFSQKTIIKRLIISVPVFILTFIVMTIDFTILWRYFGWCNQTLSVFTLWAVTVFLSRRRGWSYLMTMLPAMFMTVVCVSYLLYAPSLGIALDYSISVGCGILVALIFFFLFMCKKKKLNEKNNQLANLVPILLIPLFTLSFTAYATVNSDSGRYPVRVEKGRMVRADNGKEVAYFGTNYTLPFAHAYRATADAQVDRKTIIDNDVEHFARLGLNGFRLHLWEAELTDSIGNLIENEHLDLLDYLIAALQKKNIDIILTAQTNFGNGYPEKNIDTGSFTYKFDKCQIHENPDGQAAQENYLKSFLSHKNLYTGKTYAQDERVIGIEINNEPCHSGTKEEVTAYINRMVRAMKDVGFDRIILYNVSHNPDVTDAYYNAEIQATTYQWYPDGLVAGHIRKGNFLPVVENYDIPWKDSIPAFDKMAKIIYEFDPGDVLYTHLYPAIANTFRNEGFQWATQFAYDPTPLAPFNTEYQTHYVNLLYTPAKALSLAVASQVMQSSQKETTQSLSIDYNDDISVWNHPDLYIHTRTTSITPVQPEKLKKIMATGTSPLVEYNGTGAYFIDKIDTENNEVWLLEVLPDAVILSDPFEKTSLSKEIARLYPTAGNGSMTLSLPGLSPSFFYKRIDDSTNCCFSITSDNYNQACNKVMNITPGRYLLSNSPLKSETIKKIAADSNPILPEYLHAKIHIDSERDHKVFVEHTSPLYAEKSTPIKLTARFYGATPADSLYIYPSHISFWNDNNPLIRMTPVKDNRGNETSIFEAIIPAEMLEGDSFSYNIVSFSEHGDESIATTFPANKAGTPLDWDYLNPEYYTISLAEKNDPIIILEPEKWDKNLDISSIPDNWRLRPQYQPQSPLKVASYRLPKSENNNELLLIRKYVGDVISTHPAFIAKSDNYYLYTMLEIADDIEFPEVLSVKKKVKETIQTDGAEIAVYLTDGNVFSAPLKEKVNINDMKPSVRYVVPAPFPTFLPREISSDSSLHPIDITKIEFIELRLPASSRKKTLDLKGIMLTK